MTILRNSETPPLPLVWIPQIFLIRIFRIGRDPPPFWRKITKNSQFFSDKIPPFWQNMPKNLIFSDKPLLDWVRPPPPYAKKISVFSDKEISDFPRPPRPPFGE